MFELGQKVTVIAEKVISYDGIIVARAMGDSGLGAYKVALHVGDSEEVGQWHKASDVFVREKSADDSQEFWQKITEQ